MEFGGTMSRTCLETIIRREFLQAGLLGLFGGMAFPGVTYGSPARTGFGRAKSCILVYLLGGPSHLDMWDLKPNAPIEIRGNFKPTVTAVPGVQICEHLPLLARMAPQYAIVRSVTHPNHNHTHMTYYSLTGRHMTSPNPDDNKPNLPSRTDHPHLGAVLAKFKKRDAALPGYVALPELGLRMMSTGTLPGGNAGFLGPSYDPLGVNEDIRNPQALRSLVRPADVPLVRFEGRETLLAMIDGRSPADPLIQKYESVRESAVRMTGSTRAGKLFLLDDEPPAVRDRYGPHRFGQSLLLARRLAEAGVSLVGIHFNYMSKCDGWDTHNKNFDCLKDELLPMLDQGLSALLDDLDQRGRLDETLVVCMGEFGRTPRINPNAGRDHWGNCAAAVLAGAGIHGGQVLGSSDKIAAYPSEFPIDPADIQATIYHCLGLDPKQVMHDQLNRPLPLSTGKVITQLF